MPSTRVHFHGPRDARLRLEAPFFDELLEWRVSTSLIIPGERYNPDAGKGRLSDDIHEHALWHYFLVASNAYRQQEMNLVEESDPSIHFNAEACFLAIARQHGVQPEEMSKRWPVVEKQRIALGLTSNAELPERYKFRGVKIRQ